MCKFWKVICFSVLLLLTPPLVLAQVNVNSLRYWTAPDHTRLVFDVTSPAIHQLFLLENPTRLVVDLNDTKIAKPLKQPPENHKLFSRVRTGTRYKKNLRVVVDLKTTVIPKSFSLKPSNGYGHRLVIDLYNKKLQTVNKQQSIKQFVSKTMNNKGRDIIIALDAGHGGEDSGALGARGTQEKKVVLEIAKKVEVLINKKTGMKAVMVRKGDYYIKLRKRMTIARAAKADLFVSIHADAFKNSNVKGASVFTLSNRGASSEAARWLAQHENAADLVGGVQLADKEDMLASVLMDLSQTATKEASYHVAGKILKNFKSIGHLHKNKVQKAGFMVLKSPDIPSILVETAFISNPIEERNLRSRTHQTKMANAIFKGIVSYFSQYAPADSYFALNLNKQYVISRGDTLSDIAQRYGVSMQSIKSANAMANSRIQVGQVLNIPKS